MKMTAHTARQDLLRGAKLNAAIFRGSRASDDLSNTERYLLDDFSSGKLTRARDDCDAAFAWSRQMRSAAGSAVSRMVR